MSFCQEKWLLSFLFLSNSFLFNKEYILDSLKTYSSQVLENLSIMCSKEEFIFSSKIL